MSDTVATTGSFVGADVDGLDHLSQEFAGAAEIVDMVKTACEVIVAAASIFGPFGAAFVAYLKGTVIPWLTKVSAALKAMSKVLASHSSAQKDASSSATLPSYGGTPNLPTTSTHDAPQLPPATPSAPATAAPVTTPATTVSAPPTIGTAPVAAGGAATAAGSAGAAGVAPLVQAVTALTGLVTAVDHLVHPNSSGAAAPVPSPSVAPTIGAGISPGHGAVDVPTAPDHVSVPPAQSAVPLPSGSGGSAPSSPSGHPDASVPPAPSTTSSTTPTTAPADAVVTAAHPAAAAAAQPAPTPTELHARTIGSHDGLFTGLGQATGIGAGAAALARAVLTEARQHGDGTVLGAAPLPFEADADLPVRTEIFQGSIG